MDKNKYVAKSCTYDHKTKEYQPWYKKALEIIEGFNLSYYHSEE